MSFASNFAGFVQIQYEHVVQNHLGFSADIVAVLYTATAVLIFLSLCFRWSRNRMKLPPSPPGKWPIIGHMHLIGRDPHKSMAQLSQKYGPLMFLKLGTKPHVVVSSPDMAKEIFKHHDLTFSHRPHMSAMDQLDELNHGLAFVSNSASWRKLRKIFTAELMSSKQRQLSQRIRAEETSNLLKSVLSDVIANPREPTGIFAKVEKMTVDFLSRVLMSRRFDSAGKTALDATGGVVTVEEFVQVSDERSFIVGSFCIGDYIPWLRWLDSFGGRREQAAANESRLQGIMTVILNEHRAKRRQNGASHVDVDMIDVLLSHHEMEREDPISEENVRAVTWDAFIGGTETTVSTTEWAMAHLLQDRQILEKLKVEIDTEVGMHRKVTESDIPQLKYLQAIIKETFRLHPPVPLNLTHQSHEPCKVAGYHIPAYTQLHLNVWAVGRDPCIWERPLQFSPERFLEEPLSRIDPASGQSFELLPFGSGRRICPAASFGIVTLQLVIASIVQGFDLSVPHEVEMEETEGRFIVRMRTPLQLHMQPRLSLDLY